jgi:anthranilate synthase/aminodeoxychorismate synthase-like glutamine amidotransferase
MEQRSKNTRDTTGGGNGNHTGLHLMIDNYDSFTYNIAQAIGALGRTIKVIRNDEIDVAGAADLRPRSLIVSPGPGRPPEAGVSKQLIRHFHDKIPVLGICLGHQCIVEEFGGVIERAKTVKHGKTSNIYHDNRTIYDGLSNPFTATRYHSLIAGENTLPEDMEVSAYTSEGEIMGVRLAGRPVEGVQFHPESILTSEGNRLLENFLVLAEKKS